MEGRGTNSSVEAVTDVFFWLVIKLAVVLLTEYGVCTSGISKAPGIVTRFATHQKFEVSMIEIFRAYFHSKFNCV